ncbi:MAG: thiol:disulfide interchange protein DsbG [Alphaproteobacteria bacterium]|nr:thiol:disulfide interchange protein DsbG [Alphaproteobacteria bacterium]
MHKLTFVFLALASLAFVALPFSATAQEGAANTKIPDMPAPIANLAAEGAQVRYLGRELGLDGWLTIKRGQEQYFYVTPDGKAVMLGLLFSEDGKLVTARQLARLQGDERAVLDMLADQPKLEPTRSGVASEDTLKTPSERLMSDVEDSNWIVLGNKQAPAIYVIVDPQCPHCKEFLNDLKAPYIDTGKMQVRIIPVGLSERSMAQAAFLLAAPDPESRWFRHLEGDETALPAKQDLNTQGAQMNLGLMQAWKFDATPMTVYRNADGEIKILRGRARDIHSLFQDLI